MNAHLQLITSASTDESGSANDNDVRRLLHSTSEDRLSAVWRLIALGLLSIDEVLALEWTHVHMHSARLVTRGRDESDPDRGYRRVVDLDHGTLAALARLRRWRADARLALGADWRIGNRVVVHVDGGPMTRSELESHFDDAARLGHLPGARLSDFASRG